MRHCELLDYNETMNKLLIYNLLTRNSELLGVASAFIIFFILKSIGVSSFVAFPICMILGFGISYYLKK